MGKKPVVGLVGLCWFGLALSGCKDCDCGKDTRQAVRPTPRRAGDDGASSIANRPRSVPDNSPSIAGRGGDPGRSVNPYAFDASRYDVTTPETPPAGWQEPAGMPVNRSPMTSPAVRGGEDMPAMRTSQPPPDMPADVPPARQTSVPASMGPVHEVTGAPTQPETPVSGGPPAMQLAPASPMSSVPTPAAPKGPVPPDAIPVSTPGAAAPALPPPVETQALPAPSGPITPPAAPTVGPTVVPPPPPSSSPTVESAPKVVESSSPPLSPPPAVPPPPPIPSGK